MHMGYRYRIGLIEKTACADLRNITVDELARQVEARELAFPMGLFKEVYDLGDFAHIQEVFDNNGKPLPLFFTNAETAKECEALDAHLANQQVICNVIKLIRSDIAEEYAMMLQKNSNGEYNMALMVMFLTEKQHLWGMADKLDLPVPVDMDMTTERIALSTCWEYEIFELTRLYKTIDYNKYDVVISGW